MPRRVFVGGGVYDGGDRLLKALRARMGTRVKIMVADLFGPVPDVLELAGPAARGVYVSFLDVPPAARELSPAGRRFVRDFGALDAPVAYLLPAAQAAEVVLQAIARSDGTRGSVLEEMQATEVKGGILGSFRFDRTGTSRRPRSRSSASRGRPRARGSAGISREQWSIAS